MKKLSFLLGAALVSSCLTSCSRDTDSQSKTDDVLEPAAFFDLVNTPVGDVEFESSCDEEAAGLVERGVALTHHMMYEEADFVFGMAQNADPECAMAYWGQAMSIINPLWPSTPSDDLMKKGAALVQASLTKSKATDREKAYLQTAKVYFDDGIGRPEKERLKRFHAAWSDIRSAYPDDEDALAFYLLSSLATANPNDRTLSAQISAGDALKAILESHPDHPGALHYLLHAYDYPPLADQAVSIADHYGDITPRVPHATHMMTHIYIRLGLWDKAIEWNDVSAQTALSICKETGKINGHYTHALDYLTYAYLQKGDDRAVLDIIETTQALKPPYTGNQHASAYAFSAIPARYALELRDWEAASQLSPRTPSTFTWSDAYDPYVAITHFARAIGSARSGHPEQVIPEIQALETLRDNVATRNAYWAEQIEIQIQIADAWRLYAEGQTAEALIRMKGASELAATTEKHGITPGEVLPTEELYADMLMDTQLYSEAISAYERSLERSPNRLNSLFGMARSHELSGNRKQADIYYAAVSALSNQVDTQRPFVIEARKKTAE